MPLSIWCINKTRSGAGHGMGLDITKAALAASHQVVAIGRNRDSLVKAVGYAENLLVAKLDVTSQADADAAAQATIERFGRINVVVNNAASFYAGFLRNFRSARSICR